jgi:hypothetical protein
MVESSVALLETDMVGSTAWKLDTLWVDWRVVRLDNLTVENLVGKMVVLLEQLRVEL